MLLVILQHTAVSFSHIIYAKFVIILCNSYYFLILILRSQQNQNNHHIQVCLKAEKADEKRRIENKTRMRKGGWRIKRG